MTYKVRLQPLAENDLEEAYLWAAKSAPETAGLWLARFQAALLTLAELPQRCGLAPEHKKLKRELRQLLFGRKPNVFRAVFLMDGNIVQIIRIRRCSRRQLTREELEAPS
jgi:plasmid stabilization system protein ParE